MPQIIITDDTIASLTVEADADTRTILRALLGLPVRGRTGERVRRVLAARGLCPIASPRAA